MVIHGACHCGNIGFALSWEPTPGTIPARACDCTFCARHGGVWTSKPDGALEVTVEDPSRVERYAFGTRTATFHVCRRCGVVPVVSSEIEGRLYAVVNVNAFDDTARALVSHAPVSFEDENVESRLERRARNWIANVRFSEGACR